MRPNNIDDLKGSTREFTIVELMRVYQRLQHERIYECEPKVIEVEVASRQITIGRSGYG